MKKMQVWDLAFVVFIWKIIFLVIFWPFYTKTPISQNKVKQVGTRIFGPKWLKLGKSDLWAYQKSLYFHIFEILPRGPGIPHGNFFRPKMANLGLRKFSARDSGTPGQNFKNLFRQIFLITPKTTFAKFQPFWPKNARSNSIYFILRYGPISVKWSKND